MTDGAEQTPGQGRPAPTDTDIHPLIAARWSPRAFAERPVEREKLRALFEAARWAPSSFNEQPWRFVVATKGDSELFDRLCDYLTTGNAAWAGRAPVLVASAYRERFSHKDRHNRVAFRDLGGAEENLFLQAYAEGLVMHQMAGFDHQRLKDELLPDGFEPGTMMAIGYPGDPDTLDEKQREREDRPRSRKPIAGFVFGAEWGEPPGWID